MDMIPIRFNVYEFYGFQFYFQIKSFGLIHLYTKVVILLYIFDDRYNKQGFEFW